MTAVLTPIGVAQLIEEYSTELCRAHHGLSVIDTWYFGGSSHNDDRLEAVVGEDDSITVSGAELNETYDGFWDAEFVRQYVEERLSERWTNESVDD